MKLDFDVITSSITWYYITYYITITWHKTSPVFSCNIHVITCHYMNYMKLHAHHDANVTSANRGTIMTHYFFLDILYALWHDYIPLWHDYITYFFANVRTIIFHYFIISKKNIISLMTLLLFHLFFSSYIIAIIAIMTLLFALFLSQTIITLILFEKYYINYLFSLLLYWLWQLWHYYFHYFYCILL
jgi:hypothetical protein